MENGSKIKKKKSLGVMDQECVLINCFLIKWS